MSLWTVHEKLSNVSASQTIIPDVWQIPAKHTCTAQLCDRVCRFSIWWCHLVTASLRRKAQVPPCLLWKCNASWCKCQTCVRQNSSFQPNRKKWVRAIKTQASCTYSIQSQRSPHGCENIQVGNIRDIPGNCYNKTTGKAIPSGSTNNHMRFSLVKPQCEMAEEKHRLEGSIA